LVKEIQSITALRAATWTNHMRVFRHGSVPETGFRSHTTVQHPKPYTRQHTVGKDARNFDFLGVNKTVDLAT
jgi:hypothetical protein